MRKSYEDIVAEVKEYFLNYVNHMISIYGKDEPPKPWITIDDKAVRDCLEFENIEEVKEFLDDKISPFNIEPFLDEERLLRVLHKGYKELTNYHNGRLKRFPTILSEMCARYNEAPPFVHDQKELSTIIDCLSNMEDFSRIMVEYLENWYSLLGFSPESLKNPKASKKWNPVLTRLVKGLEAKGMGFTKACNKTAELLAIIYPRIWGVDDIVENGALIKERMRRERDKEESKRIEEKAKRVQKELSKK